MKIKSTVVIDKLEGKTVILDTENNIFVELNDIGGAVLDYIKNNQSCEMDSIINYIKKEYDVQDNDVEDDLTEFIQGLFQERILEE